VERAELEFKNEKASNDRLQLNVKELQKEIIAYREQIAGKVALAESYKQRAELIENELEEVRRQNGQHEGQVKEQQDKAQAKIDELQHSLHGLAKQTKRSEIC
jgi:hypothetical protein